MKTETIDWASEAQEYCFKYPPDPLVMSGGYGSSKTFLGCLKLIYLLEHYPGSIALVCRKVGKELKRTTMRTFFKICPEELYVSGSKSGRNDREGELTFNNGSKIFWQHLETAEVIKALQGLEINFLFFDQAEEIPEGAFTTSLGRLGRWDQAQVPQEDIDAVGGIDNWKWKNESTNKAIPPTYAILTCNPSDETHWIWRRFHPDSEEFQTKWRDLGYKMVHMNSLDNKHLPAANKQLLLQHDKAFIRRFVFGEWGSPEGQIHEVPQESLIYTDKQQAMENSGTYWETHDFLNYFRDCCKLYRSMDHGESSPTCVLWWAVDAEGNIFCFREYYMPNLLISEHRANIAALSGKEVYADNLADPSIRHMASQKNGGRWSVALEYTTQECSAPPIYWRAADNNEMATRNRISEYLKVDPAWINPLGHKRGSPRLFFVLQSEKYPSGVRNALIQLRAQKRRKGEEQGGKAVFLDERDRTVIDHAYDPIRYFMATRPPAFMRKPKSDGVVKYGDIDRLIANATIVNPGRDVVITNSSHRRQRFA